MKTMLLVAFLVTVSVRGEAAGSPTARERLRARIVESLPAPATTTPAGEKKDSESTAVAMEPVIVLESNRQRELERLMARERQEKEARRFSFTKGGMIYSNSRVELGGHWEPKEGWKFLKISW